MKEGCVPHEGRAPEGGVVALLTTFLEWVPAVVPVLAVTGICTWASEVKTLR